MSLTLEQTQEVISKYQRNEGDTGSAEVQVAFLTKNISYLTGHCQKNPKDFSSRRGLLKMVCRRRSFLHYIKQRNEAKYKELIKTLGLRK